MREWLEIGEGDFCLIKRRCSSLVEFIIPIVYTDNLIVIVTELGLIEITLRGERRPPVECKGGVRVSVVHWTMTSSHTGNTLRGSHCEPVCVLLLTAGHGAQLNPVLGEVMELLYYDTATVSEDLLDFIIFSISVTCEILHVDD